MLFFYDVTLTNICVHLELFEIESYSLIESRYEYLANNLF